MSAAGSLTSSAGSNGRRKKWQAGSGRKRTCRFPSLPFTTGYLSIENMNGLIRQYIPKKADFKGISSGYIKQIIEKLNNRPRKKNAFSKPVDMIKHKIA
jgi:IS30 family transposase